MCGGRFASVVGAKGGPGVVRERCIVSSNRRYGFLLNFAFGVSACSRIGRQSRHCFLQLLFPLGSGHGLPIHSRRSQISQSSSIVNRSMIPPSLPHLSLLPSCRSSYWNNPSSTCSSPLPSCRSLFQSCLHRCPIAVNRQLFIIPPSVSSPFPQRVPSAWSSLSCFVCHVCLQCSTRK